MPCLSNQTWSSEQIEQILAENEGLAEEVLHSYEHLGLLFDLMRRIANVTRADQVERLLMTRIGSLIAADSVDVYAHNGFRRRHDLRCGIISKHRCNGFQPDYLRTMLEQARTERRVALRRQGGAEWIVGTLGHLDQNVDVMLARRRDSSSRFTAGDLQLIESLLAFGSELIRNCELHAQLRCVSTETTRALVSAIDKKDHYTYGHSERVALLSCMVGERLGLSQEELGLLEWAGLMHDVGKIGVPEEILLKPGRLSSEEFEIIKRHPQMGHEILRPIRSFEKILDGVLYHHENPDGSGYPHGLSGEQIPLFARIIHVVDVFDALTSDRSYRPAFTPEQALEIIRQEAGTRLDAQIARIFVEQLETCRRDEPDVFRSLFGAGRCAASAPEPAADATGRPTQPAATPKRGPAGAAKPR